MTFNLDQAKSIFQSTTFWGAVLSLFSQFAPSIYMKLFGAAPQATIIADIMTGIGFIVTVYGRFTREAGSDADGWPCLRLIASAVVGGRWSFSPMQRATIGLPG